MTDEAEIVHVAWGQSRADSIRDALRLQGGTARVVALSHALNVGPIDTLDADARRVWARANLRDDDPNREWHEPEAPWSNATSLGVRPVYWVCRTDAGEHASFLELASRMAGRPFDIVDATGLDLATIGGISPVWSLGQVRPEEIVALGLVGKRRPFLQAESDAAVEAWSRLRRENAPLRIVRDGRLVSAPLLDAFRAHFGRALELLPVGDPGAGDEGWLAALTRKQRKAAHPLRHILLNLFLEAQGVARETRDAPPAAFGVGPWLCRNPLMEHHGQPVVQDLTWYRNRDTVVGVFECRCGFTYTRGVARSGLLGPPRYRAFGPSLKQPLGDWIAQRLTLRGIARRLQLDPKTVGAEADKLGLITPWTCTSVKPKALLGGKQEGTTEPSRRGLQARPAGSKSPRPRRNWPTLDLELVVRLRHLDAVIRSEVTPIRASVAEFERRLGRRGWLRKHRLILPAANAFLDTHQETIPAFQRRRLEWVIRSKLPDDPPAAWQACAIAGLGPDWLPVAERILAESLTDYRGRHRQ